MKLSKLGVASTCALVCALVVGLKVWDSQASTQASAPALHTNATTPEIVTESTAQSIDRALARRKQRLRDLASTRGAKPSAPEQIDWAKYEAELEDAEHDDRDPLEMVRKEVTLLDRQHPMEFMQALYGPPGQTKVDEATRAAAEEHVGRYVEARTSLLKEMYIKYVEDPFYEPQQDVAALLEQDQAYEQSISAIQGQLPGLKGIVDVFRETALPPPFFAKDAWNELQPPAPVQVVDLSTLGPDQEAHARTSAQEPVEPPPLAN